MFPWTHDVRLHIAGTTELDSVQQVQQQGT